MCREVLGVVSVVGREGRGGGGGVGGGGGGGGGGGASTTYAMLYLAGWTGPSPAGGSTTRWMVLLIMSLLHRASRSPAFTTQVSSIGVASTKTPVGLLTWSPPLVL